MAIILFETTSTSAAEDIVEAVAAGELWGLDMGTTSKASSYSNFALVECTRTRSENLADHIPDGTAQILWDSEPPSFTAADMGHKTWYLRGML
jgi:hypothetical protein